MLNIKCYVLYYSNDSRFEFEKLIAMITLLGMCVVNANIISFADQDQSVKIVANKTTSLR